MTPRDEWALDTAVIGRRVLVFDRLDSTNTFAAGLSGDVANDGVVVLANEQTAGRGQHGRSWQCPPGDGVLLSVLLFPSPPLRRPALLTAWAAVSVCETIVYLTGTQPHIKWPNDVLIHGRKVCGILIEQGRGTVAGIGLNLNQSAAHFAAHGLDLATSLALGTGRRVAWEQATQTLIRKLDDGYVHLCQGDVQTLENSWKNRLGLIGKEVTAECHNGCYQGRLLEMGWDSLQVEAAEGMVCMQPETVRHLYECRMRK